jgi:hypothetical protein
LAAFAKSSFGHLAPRTYSGYLVPLAGLQIVHGLRLPASGPLGTLYPLRALDPLRALGPFGPLDPIRPLGALGSFRSLPPVGTAVFAAVFPPVEAPVFLAHVVLRRAVLLPVGAAVFAPYVGLRRRDCGEGKSCDGHGDAASGAHEVLLWKVTTGPTVRGNISHVNPPV